MIIIFALDHLYMERSICRRLCGYIICIDGIRLFRKQLLTCKHKRIFPNSHSVDNRDGLHANETLEFLFKNWSINIKAVWIWAIKDKQRLVIFQRAFKQIFK